MSKKQPSVYLVFIAQQPPQRLFSTVDLMKTYLTQLAKLAESGEWWRPIEFRDDDGTLLAVYSVYAIQAIVEGVIAPEGRVPLPVSQQG